jgi:hypothetical protein
MTADATMGLMGGDSCYGDGHYCSTCKACIDDYSGHFYWSPNHNSGNDDGGTDDGCTDDGCTDDGCTDEGCTTTITCECGAIFSGDDPEMYREDHINGGHCPKTKPSYADNSSYGFCPKCKTWILEFNNSYHYENCQG